MEFIIKNNVLEDIRQPEMDVHIPEGVTKLSSDVFNSNEVTKNLFFPASLVDCNEYRSLIFRHQENIFVDDDNPVFSSYNGVLYNKERTVLICCPMGKRGVLKTAVTTKEIAQDAFCCSELDELILNEGLKSIHRWAFSDDCINKAVVIPRSVSHISEHAFESEYGMGHIIVYPETYAHYFAKRNEHVIFTCVPYENVPSWDSTEWKRNFTEAKEKTDSDSLHSLRNQIFKSTIDIVRAGKYQLSGGEIISLNVNELICPQTKFYTDEIPVTQYLKHYNTQIAAVNDDCLSFARKVKTIEDDVCVLNMASRRNPGGGVLSGAGAQEEYLFRCSDYFRSLYQFAPYAEQYDVKRSAYSYPMDRNFGGVFSPNVTIFRGTEEDGYCLLNKPWKVNIIGVAGINRPELVSIGREERIASKLVDAIKNKMRTIFRIAASNRQKTLILGALGCGAFRNPPKHTAELFEEVLKEPEFTNVFRRVFFVIKEDHNSRGVGNFQPFADIFGSINKDLLLEPEGRLRFTNSDKALNVGVSFDYILKNRCTPETITKLERDEVFVFGTNPVGEHNSAAAKYAVQFFGARMGKGEGLYGQSYAIPVHKHCVERMNDAVHRFILFARNNPNKKFLVLPVGCGKAGMETLTVATMFKDGLGVENIFLSKSFIEALQKTANLNLPTFDGIRGKLLHSEHFGESLQWSLYGDGTLEISGYGAMPDYTNHWDSYFGEGQPTWIGCEKYGVMPYRLVVANGVTYVGANAFESFGCLKEVYLDDTITRLGTKTFFDCFHIAKINVPTRMNIKEFNKAELPLFYNKAFVRVDQWLIAEELANKNN